MINYDPRLDEMYAASPAVRHGLLIAYNVPSDPSMEVRATFMNEMAQFYVGRGIPHIRLDFLGSIGAQVMMEEFEVLKKIPDIECMIDGEEEHSFGW